MQAFIPAALQRLDRSRLRRPYTSPRNGLRGARAEQSEGSTVDWRSFRARLVQNERAKTSDTKPATEEWAHEVPFVEAGCLLIASPEHFVGEHSCSFFANSVVLVLRHSRVEGTVGVILNRPVAAAVSEPRLRGAMAAAPAPLYLGGPVSLDSLLAVHEDESIPGAVPVVNGVATSAVAEVLKRIEGGQMTADKCRFFCGYSGWSPGQLQEEVDNGVWYTCASCADLVMGGEHDPKEPLVKKLLMLMGGRFTEIGKRLDDKSSGTGWKFGI